VAFGKGDETSALPFYCLSPFPSPFQAEFYRFRLIKGDASAHPMRTPGADPYSVAAGQRWSPVAHQSDRPDLLVGSREVNHASDKKLIGGTVRSLPLRHVLSHKNLRACCVEYTQSEKFLEIRCS
jgi:hypothetical protein